MNVNISGVITVKEELDREVLSTHELTIMVRDQGIPSNRNFTRVKIQVTDHNDHPPQFLSNQIEGRVFESAAVGTSVVEVIALDYDKGENAEISYSIQSGRSIKKKTCHRFLQESDCIPFYFLFWILRIGFKI